MSISGKKQLGPNERAYKYEFVLEILKLKSFIQFPCQIRFTWKRGINGIDTKNLYQAKAKQQQSIINEKLHSLSTVCYNIETKQFLKKESQLIVNMIYNGSPKKLGSCLIDLRSILNNQNYQANRSQTFQVPIKNVIDPNKVNDRIIYRLQCKFKEQIFPSEKSLGSGGTGTLNMSGLSIHQDSKNLERRYEIPSKDNYSVTSYTGGIRYPSTSKKERDDGSVRKHEYGMRKQYGTGFIGMKSNISNEYDVRSQMKSIDNKTQNNDGGNYLNKQLIEEQNKRSKAESDLARCNLFVDELKKRMNQGVIQNAKLKQQLNSLHISKNNENMEQINLLQHKIYQLNNQVRQIKTNYETKKVQCDKYESQINRLLKQKNYIENEMQNYRKKAQEGQKFEIMMQMTQNIEKQNRDLRYENQKLQQAYNELKNQFQQKQSHLYNQKFRQTQQLNNKVEYYKKQAEKLKNSLLITENLDRNLKQIHDQLSQKTKDLNNKMTIISQQEKQISENKIMINQYEAEKSFMQRQIIKLKHELSEKKDNQKYKLQTQNKFDKFLQQNKLLEERLQEKIRICLQLEEKCKYINQIQIQKNNIENQFEKVIHQLKEKQNELKFCLERQNKLQHQKLDYQNTIQHLKEEHSKISSYSSNDGELKQMMRQMVQMQIQLKYANGQLNRLRSLEEQFEQKKWKTQKQAEQKRQTEEYYQRIDKQLKNKNRSLLIQIEKSKMISQQLEQCIGNCNLYREQLERSRNIIFNGEKQLNQYENNIKLLTEENLILKNEKNIIVTNGNEEIRQLQNKVRQLEERNSQKIKTLEGQNQNLALANQEIKSLQKIAQERHRQISLKQNQIDEKNRQISIKQNLIHQIETRYCQIQQGRLHLQSQVAKSQNQKKVLEKRNQMIMQEIHMMKKRFEDQKGRSLSFTRNQESNKIRSLENEIEKREKMISKLNKQKIQLEEDNVKINVQVMKLLSEIEKAKANNQLSSHGSLKIISSIKQKQ